MTCTEWASGEPRTDRESKQHPTGLPPDISETHPGHQGLYHPVLCVWVITVIENK